MRPSRLRVRLLRIERTAREDAKTRKGGMEAFCRFCPLVSLRGHGVLLRHAGWVESRAGATEGGQRIAGESLAGTRGGCACSAVDGFFKGFDETVEMR